MIKAVCLRFKNIVNVLWKDAYKDDEIIQGRIIGVLHDTAIAETTNGIIQLQYTQFSGIPLTVELLEKCGFEKREYDKEDGGGIWFEIFNADIGNLIFDTCIALNGVDIPHCKYLHQLQNLIHALTGNELIVKL